MWLIRELSRNGSDSLNRGQNGLCESSSGKITVAEMNLAASPALTQNRQ